MSKTKARMIGLILMIISIFPFYGGLMIEKDMGFSAAFKWIISFLGLIMLITGIIFYKVIKSDED